MREVDIHNDNSGFFENREILKENFGGELMEEELIEDEYSTGSSDENSSDDQQISNGSDLEEKSDFEMICPDENGKFQNVTQKKNRNGDIFMKFTVRYFQNSIRLLYLQFVDNYNCGISFSTFKRVTRKRFVQPKKRTDLCSICLRGNRLKRISDNGKHLSPFEKRQLTAFEIHRENVKLQKKFHDSLIEETPTDSCVIITDFKEKIKIPMGPDEEGQEFYHKQQITVLTYVVIFNINGQQFRLYFNYISEFLNQDWVSVQETQSHMLQFVITFQ
jgi:hypothetical protein